LACGVRAGFFAFVDLNWLFLIANGRAFNSASDYTASKANQESIMSTSSAHDLKTKEVKAIEEGPCHET